MTTLLPGVWWSSQEAGVCHHKQPGSGAICWQTTWQWCHMTCVTWSVTQHKNAWTYVHLQDINCVGQRGQRSPSDCPGELMRSLWLITGLCSIYLLEFSATIQRESCCHGNI